MNVRIPLLALAFSLFTISACSSARDVVNDVEEEITPSRQAVAQIDGINNGDVDGTVTFQQVGDYVRVSGTVQNLDQGKHGFHIHAGTSCSDRGGHFNPEGSPHGSPDEPSNQRHVGDLGNLVADNDEGTADEDGTAEYERVDRILSLSGPNSIVGHALVVHEGEDEYIPQPSGSAGTEIGCGIIRLQGDQN